MIPLREVDMNLRNIKYIAAMGLLVAIVFAGCAANGSSASLGDASSDVATIAAALDANVSTNATIATNESVVGMESSGAAKALSAISLSGARAVSTPITVTVTVTHSDGSTTGTDFAADVVTVVRTWTTAQGAAIVDTVTRPEVPVGAARWTTATGTGFTYAPSPSSSTLTVTSGTVILNKAYPTVTISGTEVRAEDGVQVSSNDFSMTYLYNSAGSTAPAQYPLYMVTKTGETVSGTTGNVTLTSTIWHDAFGGYAEFLRAIDYVNVKTPGTLLKREVIAQNASTTVPADVGSFVTSPVSQTLKFTPTPPSDSTVSSFAVIYRSDPSLSVSTFAPVPGTSSSYPPLMVAGWVRIVLEASGPRIVDWYKPINQAASGAAASYNGTYVRRYQITSNGAGSLSSVYKLSDGVTQVKAGASIRFVTAANDSLATTTQFADGKSYAVTITPLADGRDGYAVTRNDQTYAVVYTRDASTGAVTTIAVTINGATTTYAEDPATGVWTKQ
jgi:predicted RNA-binding protein with TRAM domain